MSGLIVGSLTPDFEYFLRMSLKSDFSHSWPGLFWFDLPLGVVLAFIFHTIVRDSLIKNSPTFFKQRFYQYLKFDWTNYFQLNWIVVAISISIGAASHIFWDDFTHSTGYFVVIIPWLRDSLIILGSETQVFKILQHSSSILGAIIVVVVIYKLPKTEIRDLSGIQYKFWLLFIFLAAVVISIRLLAGLELMAYGSLIVTLITACIISLTLTSLVFKETSVKGSI